jgi:hypothetical protein
MNLQRVHPQVVVLFILVSSLAFCAGHLWRHADLPKALAATGLCLLAIVAASAISATGRARPLADD